jgi:hypothetical protein
MFPRALLVFILGVSAAHAKPNLQPHIRPSLKEMGGRLQKGDEISALYKAALKDPSALTAKKLAALEKPNRTLLREFQNLALDSASFARGEIEDEVVLNRTLELLQLSLLRMRQWSTEEPAHRALGKIKEECNTWFQFAADLPYNEASLIGLRVAGVIRSFLIDELEHLERARGAQMSQDEVWLNWFLQLRTPWPVDRMILTEARRILHPESMSLAEKIALKIQKNPYLSVDSALKQIPGGKPQEVLVLKNLWREQDMEGMKTEINRLQSLRLKLASRLFEKRKGKRPEKVQELVDARLLASAPIDYFTGRPMQLPQLDKKDGAGKSP